MFKIASAKHFYPLTGKLLPWLSVITSMLFISALYLGLFDSPPDYQQGETVRIMYIHVPSAWMSMFIYASMAVAAATGLIWKIKLTDVFIRSSATIGASFTLLALLTGSLWGKPMWGTWWVWDARLTSELILFFLYLGFIALTSAIDDERRASRAGSVLLLIGVVNLPVIHFSVEWWNTLHQPSSVARAGGPTIQKDILIPLLTMAAAFQFYYFTMVLVKMRAEILATERHKQWLQGLKD